MHFEFSQKSSVRIVPLGNEGEPVAIIDNAMDDPAALIEFAASKTFAPIGPYYPGIRAPTGEVFKSELCASIQDIVRTHFKIKRDDWKIDCFLSLVTTPPERLAPIQRLPHYDGIEHDRIAIVYFLSHADQGGTSFYRHKTTEFETVTADRFPIYKSALEQDVREHGLPPPRYIEDGAPIFERTETINAAYNRMLIYRGVNLHCGAIDNKMSLSADPRCGRLTINAFLQPV